MGVRARSKPPPCRIIRVRRCLGGFVRATEGFLPEPEGSLLGTKGSASRGSLPSHRNHKLIFLAPKPAPREGDLPSPDVEVRDSTTEHPDRRKTPDLRGMEPHAEPARVRRPSPRLAVSRMKSLGSSSKPGRPADNLAPSSEAPNDSRRKHRRREGPTRATAGGDVGHGRGRRNMPAGKSCSTSTPRSMATMRSRRRCTTSAPSVSPR